MLIVVKCFLINLGKTKPCEWLYNQITRFLLIGAGGTMAGFMWLFSTFDSPIWGMKWGLYFFATCGDYCPLFQHCITVARKLIYISLNLNPLGT